MITIEPATMSHAARIHLRAADALEIERQGLDKMEALAFSLSRSIESLAYLVDGEVAAIHGCGLRCMLGGYATPWFVTGPPIERVKKDFIRLARARVADLHQRYGVLINYVHADYRDAVKLMRRLGFEISAPMPLGPFGAPFVRVTMGGPDGH